MRAKYIKVNGNKQLSPKTHKNKQTNKQTNKQKNKKLKKIQQKKKTP